MQADFSSLGKRLRWAMDQRPHDGRKRGLRKFQADLEEVSNQRLERGLKPIPGVTLPSVASYRSDAVEPTLDFLREAADLCAVDLGWLVTGSGHPTEDHRRAALTAAATVGAQIKMGDVFDFSSSPGLEQLHRKLFELLGRPMSDPPPPWLSGLIEIWLQLRELDESADREEMIHEAVVAPLTALGASPKVLERAGLFDHYVFAWTTLALTVVLARKKED